MLNRAVLALILALSAAPALAAPVVQTTAGTVEGEAHTDVSVFRGVPFAAPPVGALRWRAPQPAPAWRGVRAAKAFSPVCLQPPGGKQAQSEDCLYLNIYAPVGAKGAAVMVWIPGGGLIAGGASEPTFDGSNLARQGVVVVTLNYRLGPLGFFAHPALTAANEDGGRLFNYGLMDQVAALDWVRRNIAAFGGDPARVTIFGVSAGGASVNALMVSKEARGLFSAAISQSGYGRGFFRRISVAENGKEPAERVGLAIAETLGKPGMTLAELRAVPAAQIVGAHDYGRESLFAVDGKVLEGEFQPAFSAGRQAPVPFLLGSNSAEMATAPPETRRKLASSLGQGAFASLTALYGGEAQRELSFASDVSFGSQARGLALRHAAKGYPTYVYRFSVIAPDGSNPHGASHGAETPYVFGTIDRARGEPKPTRPSDLAVSAEMMTRWVAFAKTHRPDAEGLVPWPAYGRDSLVLDFTSDGARAGPDPLAARFDAINAAGD